MSRPGAVIVASGGLEANQAWLERNWGAGARNFAVRGTPDNDGSLLLALLELGAAPTGSNLFHSVAVDARSPRHDGGIVTRVDSIPFSVTVNKNGERFYDEGEDCGRSGMRPGTGNRPSARSNRVLHLRRAVVGPVHPAGVPPFVASTLEELLGLFDVDLEQTLATIPAYNDDVDDSAPFDPGRKDSRSASSIRPSTQQLGESESRNRRSTPFQ